MDEHRGSTSTINFDILSVGTANAQSLAKGHASLVDNAGTRPRSRDEMQQHTLPEPHFEEDFRVPVPEDALPSPNFSRLSPLRGRPLSTGKIEDLRRSQTKSRSIIDPGTVRLSFTGSISDIGLALPLEEGLQKLYLLYNEHTNPAIPLPHTLPITDVPLSTIADALSTHIRSQSATLFDCAQELHGMTNLHEKLKQDLITLEQHYSLAVEKANIAAMSTEEVRRRLGWQVEEIIRINTEKEFALKEAAFQKNEAARLISELHSVAEILQENARLKKESSAHDREVEMLEGELAEVKSELKAVKKKLESVPRQIVRVYGKLADGDGRERKRLEKKTLKRGNAKLETGLLIPASPSASGCHD